MDQDPGIWHWIVGGLVTALGILGNHRIKTMEKTVKQKADQQALADLRREHAQTTGDLSTKIQAKADEKLVGVLLTRLDLMHQDQKEDSKHLIQEIGKVYEAHHRFTEKIIEELGRRPTREEIKMLND